MATAQGEPTKIRAIGSVKAPAKKSARQYRHTKAMMESIKEHGQIHTSIKESLLGLARAWDQIEATGKGMHTVPSIAREIRATWEQVGVIEDEEDIWENLS
jgi:hypothetical protein